MNGRQAPPAATEASAGPPLHLFALQLVYLTVLLALLGAYEKSEAVRDFFPQSLGDLPIGTPWFGAVGAVVISLTGVFLHRRDWDASFEYWHIARPLIGAVVGSIGCLILVTVVDVANSRPTSTNPAFYYVVAFLVGYREETFRALIKRATDVILSPGRVQSPGSGDSGNERQ